MHQKTAVLGKKNTYSFHTFITISEEDVIKLFHQAVIMMEAC